MALSNNLITCRFRRTLRRTLRRHPCGLIALKVCVSTPDDWFAPICLAALMSEKKELMAIYRLPRSHDWSQTSFQCQGLWKKVLRWKKRSEFGIHYRLEEFTRDKQWQQRIKKVEKIFVRIVVTFVQSIRCSACSVENGSFLLLRLPQAPNHLVVWQLTLFSLIVLFTSHRKL